MSIVALADIKNYLGIAEADDSENDELSAIHDGIERFVKSYCDRDFESTSYIEAYDGDDTQYLFLKQYPVTAVTRVGAKAAAIKIKNTSLDASNAYVTVDSTGITLVVDGGANDDTTALTYANYATLSTLVAAINAVGKGWEAAVYDSDYNDYLSSNLVHVQNFFCGSWDNVEAVYSYLDMIGKPYQGYEVYEDEGYIYYVNGFAKGNRNIIVKYTAGYSSTTMPADLKLAILEAVKFVYQQRDEDTEGVRSLRLGDYNVQYEEMLPARVMTILDAYRRVDV